jgi:chromate transport protein ChrA
MESFYKAVKLTVPIVIGAIVLVVGIMSYDDGQYTQAAICTVVLVLAIAIAIQQLWEIVKGDK